MTKRIVPTALIAIGLFAAGAASAQFKLDVSPSGQRAAFAADTAGPAKPDLNKNRLHALSPLGGPQTGSPLYIQPAAPMQSADSAPAYDPPRPGVGASAALADAAPVEDPYKPRQPLRPQTLTKAATPKP